ncbi:MAG: aminotransferase class I/II-fold pyridoxal phosphate-dependent enzyme, partial [Pseudolabrys sp.]
MVPMTAQREPSSSPATATQKPADARSPFVRLTELIAGIAPGKPAINLSIGEPQHPIPSFVGPELAAHLDEFGRYPANKGGEPFRRAVAQWLGRRYGLARPVDAEREVLVLNGTREGLFLGAIAAKRWVSRSAGNPGTLPAMLIPNPFYAAYAAGAIAADCEPVYMPARKESGFLPDLDALDDALLARTVAFYIASPSNPQGAVASRAYLDKLGGLARRFGFLVFADECYCEIYSEHPPAGMLEASGPDFANTVVFHSLSKRSNLPGLRVGFATG